MANDIDIWQDIEHLEKAGRKQEASDLLEIYRFVYIEETDLKKARKLQDKFIKKYRYNPKVI